MSPNEFAALAAEIAAHKSMRPWLHSGRTVRLEHPDPGCVAMAVIGEAHAFVSAVQTATPLTATLSPLRVRGLAPDTVYEIRPLHPPRRARATVWNTPFLARGEVVRARGQVLAHAGLPLPTQRAGEIVAFILEAL